MVKFRLKPEAFNFKRLNAMFNSLILMWLYENSADTMWIELHTLSCKFYPFCDRSHRMITYNSSKYISMHCTCRIRTLWSSFYLPTFLNTYYKYIFWINSYLKMSANSLFDLRRSKTCWNNCCERKQLYIGIKNIVYHASFLYVDNQSPL